MHNSRACKLSITSSNNETADGDYLFRTKLILKSLASLEAPGGPMLTKNDKGRSISATDVLKVPLCVPPLFDC